MMNETWNITIKALTVFLVGLGLFFAFSKPSPAGNLIIPVDCTNYQDVQKTFANSGFTLERELTSEEDVLTFVEHIEDPMFHLLINMYNTRVEIYSSPRFPRNGLRYMLYANIEGSECVYFFGDFVESES